MSQPHWIAVLSVLLMAPLAVAQSNPDNARSSSPSDTLQPLSAFADIADDTQRARAVRRNRQGHPTPALRQLPSPHRTSAPG